MGYFDWRVLAGAVLLAVAVGAINNMRVYDEQRVEWFGGPAAEPGAGAE